MLTISDDTIRTVQKMMEAVDTSPAVKKEKVEKEVCDKIWKGTSGDDQDASDDSDEERNG